MTAPAPAAGAETATAPLVVDSVGYTYAGARTKALVDVSLDVPAGRIVAVVGPNDGGKSTLCLVAAGLAPAVIGGRLAGEVRLSGASTADLRPHEAAQRCGILFQDPLTQLSGTAETVWEEIALGPRNVGLALPEIVQRVGEAMASLGIGDLAARDPTRLSGGQAQLVALASVIALRPACLVLDEPTSQLDPSGTRLVGAAIRRLAKEAGTAVLLVEHKTGLVAEIADEACVLAEGRLVARGAVEAVLSDGGVEALGIDLPPAVRLAAALTDAGADPATAARVRVVLAAEGLR